MANLSYRPCPPTFRKVNTGLAYDRKISCGAGDPAAGLMTIVTGVLKSLRNGNSSALGVNTDSVVLYLYLYIYIYIIYIYIYIYIFIYIYINISLSLSLL